MAKAINPNFRCLVQNHQTSKGIRLAGSSRSGKTWSTVLFFVWLATVKRERGTVHIVRSTYNSFKTTLYDDFKRIFEMAWMANPFELAQEVRVFSILGLKFHFIGADKVGKAKGAGADYVWFNEVTEIPKEIFDQKEMRCRKMWIADYNPSEHDHWIYPEQMKREDVATLHTTFLDNPFVSETEKRKILSYEPTPENIERGTSDPYMWSVYGMGKAAIREGAIITNWEQGAFDDSLPYVWGMDFGYTQDPTTLVKVAVKDNLIYAKEYLYQTGLTTQQIADILSQHTKKDDLIIADGAESRLIDELWYLDFNIHKAKKGADSVRYGLQKIRERKLIADGDNLIKEVKNYVWLDGRSNTPIDKHNHCFVGDTEITTIRGLKKIKEIQEGDLVLTSNGYKEVLIKFNNGVKKVYSFRIVFDMFSVYLRCTNDHLIKTNRGWIAINQLKKLDVIFLHRSSMEKSISYTKTKDTLVKELKGYTGLFGNLIKEVYQKAITYTTLTGIHTITIYQTLHSLMHHFMQDIVLKKDLQKIRSLQKNFTQKGLRQLNHGINQKKGLTGIKNTLKTMLSDIGDTKKNAKTVYLNLLEKQKAKNSAAIIVNQRKEENSVLTTRKEFAQYAQKNIKHLNTEMHKVVHVHVQTLSEEEVFDLMVDKDHEYFANGILVHNCIDALRYSLEDLITNF